MFDSWLSRLEAAPLFAFDTETTSLNYMQAEIVGLSFAIEPGEAAYVPLAHLNPGLEGQLDRDRILDQMKPLLESDAVKKVGQHLSTMRTYWRIMAYAAGNSARYDAPVLHH